MPLLSVIIPTYNSEKTLERCLRSLICQTFRDFEICIIDGYSKDKTVEKAYPYLEEFKSTQILIQKDDGVYDAMNKGINIASGKWVYFLGSDDEVYSCDVFSSIFGFNFPDKVGMIYGNVYSADNTSWSEAGQIYDGEFNLKKLLSRNICHQAIFYRTKFVERLGGFDLQYPITSDWDLNLRFFTRYRSVYVDKTIASFSGGGISSGEISEPVARHVEYIRKQSKKLKTLYFFNSLHSLRS